MTAPTASMPSSADKGRLGVAHLKRYWAKIRWQRNGMVLNDTLPAEWEIDNHLLNTLRLGLEETLKYLYAEEPTFEAFEDWIAARQSETVLQERVAAFNRFITSGDMNQENTVLPKPVLTDEEIAHWNSEGYVIVRQSIPKEDCDEAVAAICELLSVDLSAPSTWYNPHPAREGIMIQLFDHPVIERIRHAQRIRNAYMQLWGRGDLQVNTDKVGFNPPETGSWKFPGSGLHWDVSLKQPVPFGTQGILYLSDTSALQGAFTLVPGFHRRISQWLQSLPAGADPRKEDLYKLGVKPVAANAGDLIIWHHALPHAASANRAESPRFVQYLNYAPAITSLQDEWI
ncbi:MAG: phytanoyl-CoA dioxygenase family protein [Chitinophagaceae bacterium]|nr:phytanoyl-CoA dioxygenase family protein [Chitinophagaceae bacterium]